MELSFFIGMLKVLLIGSYDFYIVSNPTVSGWSTLKRGHITGYVAWSDVGG